MALTKKDEERIREIIRECGADMTAVVPKIKTQTWEPGLTLLVMVDGEEHEVAMNPYFEYDEDGDKKTEFTWDEAMEAQSKMPDGWRLPTRHELVEIIEQRGQDADGDINSRLSSATGWSGYYWSSTEYNSNDAYTLFVNSSGANVYDYYKTNSYYVVCYR